MSSEINKHYVLSGGPKGVPLLGALLMANRDPLGFLSDNGRLYGDVVPFTVLGRTVVQVNHPDLIRHVLMDNHKNYYKSPAYIRFESAIGKGLLTSNGEKWRRDRQTIQPMFRRELVEGFYFSVINEVGEKYKQRWLALTEKGDAEVDITHEMAAITLEVISRIIFGKDTLDERATAELHHSYDVLMDYLAKNRLHPKVDMGKVLHTPRYRNFRREVDKVYALLGRLIEQYRKEPRTEAKYNMLALLIEAQKNDPEHFSEHDVLEHAATMIFAGFETTSILMQWMWYALSEQPAVEQKLREEIVRHLPSTQTGDSSGVTFDALMGIDYLTMVFKETMRLYPPLWMTGRLPVAEDSIGGYKVTPQHMILLPQIVMHRHPRWWHKPDAFIPERFTPGAEENTDEGLYFPFSQGARKCSGYRLAEMEAKLIFAKLLPLFSVTMLTSLGNGFNPTISLKSQRPLRARIQRV
jgi:cytochrome P450